MKIIFFGTPEYVVPILTALHKEYNSARERLLVGVITQEPKESGREKMLEYSAVDTFAHKHKIPIFFLPKDTNDLPEADLGICAAYGKIIPDKVINHFPMGILNIHPSLLPQFRGASPIQSAIALGMTETGVTVIKMDSGMDTGDIVSSFKSQITETDTNESLRTRLFTETKDFLMELIPAYVMNKVNLKKQSSENISITKPIKKEDGFVSLERIKDAVNGNENTTEIELNFVKDQKIISNATQINNLVRALTPWPQVYTTIKLNANGIEKRLKILKSHIEDSKLVLDEVQIEGKNPVSFEQFKSGYPEASF